LSGSSPDVITWLRDSGRSYGVRPHFATQYLDQLEQEVRRAMLTYPVLVGFKQNSGPVAEQLVEDFCGDGTEWAKSDVLNLPLHHAIVRANVGHRRQPPFSFASAYYIDPGTGLPDTARFLADQQLGEAAAEVARCVSRWPCATWLLGACTRSWRRPGGWTRIGTGCGLRGRPRRG